MKISFKLDAKRIVRTLQSGIIQMMSANVLNKIVAMISNMVITRILSVDEFGSWSYILNIYSYLSLISGFGLLNGALQFGTENNDNETEYQYYKYAIKKGMIIDTIIVVVLIIISMIYEFSIPNVSGYLATYVPILLVEYLMTIFMNLLRSNNNIKLYARSLNINTILVATGTCMGAMAGINGVILGKYCAFIVSVIIVMSFSKEHFPHIYHASSLSSDNKKSLWHYSVFTGISAMLNCLLYLLDVTMIGRLIKDSQTIAIYKVGTLIPNALTFIPSSIVVSILPSIIMNRDNNQWLREKVKKIYLMTGVLNFVIAIGGIVFAKWIIRIIAGKGYSDSVIVFQILLIGYAFSGTFRSMSINILSGLKRVYFNLFISIFSGVTDIWFNYLFITRKGMIGAAYATLVTEILTAIISFGYVVFIIYNKKKVNEDN